MSTPSTVCDPFRDPTIPSLADVLAQFEGLSDETGSRKARVRAAVAMFGRLMNRPVTEIPAQPNFVMREFFRIKKRPTGLSAKSLANCKSEMRYLMEKCGAATGRSRFRPLTPDWVVFRDGVAEDPLFWKVSRLAAFCSGDGIPPTKVDDALVCRFLEALTASGDVEQPAQKFAMPCERGIS